MFKIIPLLQSKTRKTVKTNLRLFNRLAFRYKYTYIYYKYIYLLYDIRNITYYALGSDLYLTLRVYKFT